MDIGFIGLGKMGFPMARRLIEAKHQLTVFDTRKEAVDQLVALGAQAASQARTSYSSTAPSAAASVAPRKARSR
jgi:3-hydroxyisobutyrate dehydrogenase-like beta-hydroxyacid dehydrogenase